MERQTKHLAIFLLRVLGTSNFWLLFLASFTCVLMMAWRGSIRDDLFKIAQKSVGKKGW